MIEGIGTERALTVTENKMHLQKETKYFRHGCSFVPAPTGEDTEPSRGGSALHGGSASGGRGEDGESARGAGGRGWKGGEGGRREVRRGADGGGLGGGLNKTRGWEGNGYLKREFF